MTMWYSDYALVDWEGSQSYLLDSRTWKKLTSSTKMETACFCRMCVFTH